MPVCIALLRGVNLAGKRKVMMADLRQAAERVGVDQPRTLLNSGNLVFRHAKSPKQLEALLEAEVRTSLGIETEFFVRTAKEWSAIIGDNPFPQEAKRDPGRFILMLLKSPTTAEKVKALQAAIVGREQVRGEGRHIYAVYPDGMGTSKLTSAVIDRALGNRVTARNWNTVLKLSALAT